MAQSVRVPLAPSPRPSCTALARSPQDERGAARAAGFCEDKPCECTSPPVIATCHRHPECRNKHVCKLPSRGSEQFVDHARRFAAALASKGKVLGYGISKVKVTPFYDDCWPHRGRCQGHRPCREPVDVPWTCRATAMYCASQSWQAALSQAKSWIPAAHPSLSMLYLFDGQVTPPPAPKLPSPPRSHAHAPTLTLPRSRSHAHAPIARSAPLNPTPPAPPRVSPCEWRHRLRSTPILRHPHALRRPQTTELLDETFRTWGAQTVGFGSDALIFGPQVGRASAPAPSSTPSPLALNHGLSLAEPHFRPAHPPPPSLVVILATHSRNSRCFDPRPC